jgi:molybdopterin-binding protein
LKGRVKSVEILRGSAFVEVAVDLGSAVLPVRVTRAAVEALAIGPGQEIWALIKTVSLADWSD